MATAPSGSYFLADRASPTKSRDRHLKGTVHVADHPPFGVGDKRFSKHDAKGVGQDSPAYHVAYNEVSPSPSRAIKGWSTVDDPIKRGRGTTAGKQHSPMAQPSGQVPYGSSLLPLTATYPNETRLQELIDLQRRKQQTGPAPNAYEVPGWQPLRTTFRRPAQPSLDGPFFLGTEQAAAMGLQESTRAREIAAVLRNPADSGLGPGDYDADKDVSSGLRHAPAPKIGTAARIGPNPHAKTLSVSRSIQHGIDWHVPVIVQPAPPKDQAAESQTSPAAAGTRTGAAAAGPPLSTSPRYMDPSPPRQLPVAQPPAPPPAVARSVRKQVSQVPGAWDWDTLAHNFRATWTKQHGGAYTHGDRMEVRRSSSAPPYECTAPPVPVLDFGPDSHVDLNSLPLQPTSIFPIPEEESDAFRETVGDSPETGQRRTGGPGTVAPSAPNQTLLGRPGGGMQGPSPGQAAGPLLPPLPKPWPGGPSGSPVGGSASAASARGLPPRSAKDLEQHSAALQAAAQATQLNARRNDWSNRSSAAPGSAAARQ
ncbi:hypothetical protein V8C86DRAFT_2977699 [Haematococcus lacustris]